MIQVVRGSLVEQDVDAIVNAANTLMRGGGGIDGRIHQLAGPKMLLELQRVAPKGANVAEVIVTPGFDLKAKHVLHVTGPIWRGGEYGEPALLAACYQNAVEKAEELGCASMGFCSISTGAYRFPLALAARIALQTVRDAAGGSSSLKRISFTMFGAEEYAEFTAALAEMRI